MGVRPVAALVAVSLATGGCSALFVKKAAPGAPGELDCTTSQTYPVLDFGGAAALVYLTSVSPTEPGAPLFKDTTALTLLTGAAVAAASGGMGLVRVNECKRLKEEQELRRAMRPFETRFAPPAGIDPWMAGGAPPEGFTLRPPQPASPDAGAPAAEAGP